VGLTLTVEVYEQLRVIAQAENRSLSNLVESWVLEELARRRKKR
jgi:predicted CopG family antitoxin